jgi:hypothetical protein
MSSNQIPGVPEGWELVHANRFAIEGEWYIDSDGSPHLQRLGESAFVHCIIRKIEKPAAYRPFANAEEFKPHRDRWARVIKEHNMSGCDLDDWLTDSLRFMGQDKTGVCAPGGWLTYGCAFDCFVFDDDGTPFGVRIDE